MTLEDLKKKVEKGDVKKPWGKRMILDLLNEVETTEKRVVVDLNALASEFAYFSLGRSLTPAEIGEVLHAHVGISQNEFEIRQLLSEMKKIVEVQNPNRLITCVVFIGKSKEETIMSFPMSKFISIENNYLKLVDEERRLKLDVGQQGVIDRQLSGETKI